LRILHTVEFYNPSVGGAQEVVRQISERLVQRGHEVTVATTHLPKREHLAINGVQIKPFAISGNVVRGFNGDVHAYYKFLLQSDFDLVMNYAAQQWATDLMFPILDHLPYAALMAPCGFSGLLNPQYADYFDHLPSVLKRYDWLIFHSDTYQDVNFAREHDVKTYSVIPNGAAQDEFEMAESTFRSRYNIPEDSPLLLTVGSHTGLKGHRLVMDAFHRADIGRAVLVVIGNTRGSCFKSCAVRSRLITAGTFGRKRVLVLDPPRADVVAAYRAADLFVFGSNVECSPLVLFEAMASKTPFVSVACGNAVEIAEWGNSGRIIPSTRSREGYIKAHPQEVARAIEKLFMSPNEKSQLAEQGYQAWRQRFTWGKITDRYEQLYEHVIRLRRCRTAS